MKRASFTGPQFAGSTSMAEMAIRKFLKDPVKVDHQLGGQHVFEVLCKQRKGSIFLFFDDKKDHLFIFASG